jgi:glycosyltransferase involved in cell wall biosynthesis
MKIALVVPGGVDASGTERVIPALLWLIERLALRHTVRVLAMHQEPAPAEWTLLGAHVYNIGLESGRRRRFFARFAAEHRAAPFDVVHAIFANALAAVAAWRHGIPLVVHLAGGEPVALQDIAYGGRCSGRGRMQFRLATAAAGRVTVATNYMQRIAGDLGIAADVVPLGVALDRWRPTVPRPREPGRPARLLHIGDLRPVKDQRMLLTAGVMLREAGVDFELDMAGVDTMNGALQRTPAARRIEDRTRWHGLLGRDALRALAGQADLLLVSSRHEAGPLAVLEAAVAGVPTVGTAVGQAADWAPAAAVAVPVGDADAFARAIASLLKDEPRRMRLAHEAQRRALRHDADFTAATFERIYDEIQDPVPARPPSILSGLLS